MGVEQGLLALIGAADVGGYEIEQSLRFDGSSHLNRTPSSAGSTTTWTWSGWLKVSPSGGQTVFSAPKSTGYTATFYNAGGFAHIKFAQYVHPTNEFAKATTASYRDPSAWFHLVVVCDTTNATASDRIRYYINGEQVTAFSNDGSSIPNLDPSSSQATGINSTSTQRIGVQFDGTYGYFDGYMAEVHMLDGTAVTDALDFGEYDDNGVWRPIRVSGVTYGTNGYYLTFDPSATNGIGHDHSGNGNNWTATGFTTSGTGTDVMSDTPTKNWCTLNPLNTRNNNTSNGNLTYSQTNDNNAVSQGTMGMPSGKWYWEINAANVGNGVYGITRYEYPTQALYGCSNGYGTGFSPALNTAYINSSTGSSSYCSSPSAPASGTYMFAFDADARKFWMGVNGTWYTKTGGSAGDPGAGTNELFGTSDITAGVVYRALIGGSAVTTVSGGINFGQRDFAYTPPTGFKALNTSNLPAPDIADGSQYFNTKTYTGNGSTQTITGVGFQPDLVWVKSRSQTVNHVLFDAVRGFGSGNELSSDSQNQEGGMSTNLYGYVSGVNSTSDGSFTVAAGTSGANYVNVNSQTYVGWSWKEGAIPGFDIVTYTGNGYPTTNTQNISHSLGVAPSFITIKNRDRSSQWLHYVKPLGATKAMEGWHDYDVARTSSAYFNDTEPTDTQFTVGRDSGGNWQGDDFIAYLWAEVDGFFKVGTYERNGSTDGPFIYLGFTPALIIIKEYAAGTEGWAVYDNKRPGYNTNDNPVLTNSTNSESYMVSTYANEIDLLSNGFKIRTTDSRYNSSLSSYRYLYWAWAVNPFGGSGVSPATAR